MLNAMNNPAMTSILGLSNLNDIQQVTLSTSGIVGTLDLSGKTALTVLRTNDCPALTSINVSGNSALVTLNSAWNKSGNGPLTSINLSGCTSLGTTSTILYANNQSISSLDISSTSFVYSTSALRIMGNNMTSLIVPATGSTLTQWRTAGNATNDAFHLAGNNFGTGNVGITQ